MRAGYMVVYTHQPDETGDWSLEKPVCEGHALEWKKELGIDPSESTDGEYKFYRLGDWYVNGADIRDCCEYDVGSGICGENIGS